MMIDVTQIKDVYGDCLARSLLAVTEKMFENPAIQEEFKRWQETRRKREVAGHVTD